VKTLILMRHGHASDAPRDCERPLSAQGQQTVRRRAAQLAVLSPRPTHVLCSSASRALQTAQLIATQLGGPLQAVDELYLASASRYARAIAALGEEVKAVVVVGHNPGLSTLGTMLLNREVSLAPGDFVVHEFEGPAWTACCEHRLRQGH
jgi:phosphohistidine phosphatase